MSFGKYMFDDLKDYEKIDKFIRLIEKSTVESETINIYKSLFEKIDWKKEGIDFDEFVDFFENIIRAGILYYK